METGNLELIITLVSIIGTVLAAFGFLYHEMRRRFDRVDEKFDSMNEDVTDLKVSVARIEGYLGIGIPGAGEQREGDGPPERAA